MSNLRELALLGSWSKYLAPTCNSRSMEDVTPTAMAAPHFPLDAEKAALRRHAFAARLGCDPALGAAMAAHVLAAAAPPEGAVVAGFWPMGAEIDPRPLMQALAERGHALVLPVTPPRGQPLRFRRWQPGEPLAPGPMGTSQPAAGEWLDPDWLLVPLLAFDRRGGRLGYGGGYYDRTLAGLPNSTAIGIAFSTQEVPEVPTGPLDQRLPMIATESGLIVTGA
ncbi:5-formyltetrahydrofolate cyclo-ligase [Humitalea rosea]|uniref:5-formyltetrahydrofolate cyclo-ligase n=2 Tax=Humitalea rosea TaxID=990373 RepID=A0A2W7IG42_9PROT|nr:5-formyltetrahydrofolate cyclo-ligase [Humitalea rosea]